MLHNLAVIYLALGVLGSILIWTFALGLDNLALLLLLSATPFGVFFWLLSRRRFGKLFWTAEAAMLSLAVGILLVSLLAPASAQPTYPLGTVIGFVLSYFVFVFVTLGMLVLLWGTFRLQLALHNLDQLAVAVATGGVKDTDRVARRFERIMQPFLSAEIYWWTRVAPFLDLRRLKDLQDYKDDVAYQWAIETYGDIPFGDWVSQNESRLRELFKDGLRTASAQSPGPDDPKENE